MTVDKLLFGFGILLVIAGVIGGIINFSNVDFEGYKMAKEVADELYDNEYAQAELATASAMYNAQLSYAVYTLFGGIIGGLLLVGFGRLLELANERNELLRKSKDAKLDSVI